MPDEITAEVVEEVKRAATTYAVELVGISGTFNMIHPDQTR